MIARKQRQAHARVTQSENQVCNKARGHSLGGAPVSKISPAISTESTACSRSSARTSHANQLLMFGLA